MNRGFTLIETIVVAGLTALISGVLAFLIVYFYRTNTYTIQEATAVSEARSGIEDSMRYIREASYGADGSYPIANAGTSTITFYASPSGDTTAVDKMSYVFESGTLYRITTESAGDPPAYTGTTSTTTIAQDVVNGTTTPVFKYYDSSGNELSEPINLADIASVLTTVVVDVDINRAPVAFTLSGSATLRNLEQ